MPHSIAMTSSGLASLIAISTLSVLLAGAVGLRIWGRVRGAGIQRDDIFSVVALVLASSTIGLNAAVFTSGVGWDFNPVSNQFTNLNDNLPFIMKITFAFTLVYITCLACLKLSQIELYLRIFTQQQKLRIIIYIIGGIVIAWAIVFTFLFIFMCRPIHQQWTIDRIGHCMDQITLLKSIIVTNGVTDLAIVLIPMKPVWKLQMAMVEKLTLIACFGMGIACCIISAVRLKQIYTVDLIGNLTGTSLTTFTLCTIELQLAGLCVNLPMLRPIYHRWRKEITLSSNRDQGNGHVKSTVWIPLSNHRSGESHEKGITREIMTTWAWE